MTQLNWFQRWWLRLIDTIGPYLISPIGRPTKWRVIVYAAAQRGSLVVLNRYPRQVIGVGIRLPDMQPVIGDPRRRSYHLRLSIVWAKPHGARRWRRRG